ncbi:ABC transporter ATP-binding protein [Nocardia sp. NPDC003345]
MSDDPLISVRQLGARAGDSVILREIDLDIAGGEVVALFGPSGAGKTTIAAALAAMDRPGIELTGEIRRADGVRIGYLPQYAASTLNPARRIGAALGELVALRQRRDRGARPGRAGRRARIAQVLAAAAFEIDDRELDRVLRRYPFEFSGGERARLALAQVLAWQPDVLVVDEPTVGLDGPARTALLAGLRGVRDGGGAVVLVTHDAFAVRQLADRTLFVRDGRLDAAGRPELATGPVPRRSTPPATAPILRVRDLTVRRAGVPVLRDIDLDLHAGEWLGLVGVSGAGKTTLARCLAGLVRPSGGRITDGAESLPVLRRRSRPRIAAIQYIWQESAGSFDPRRPVLDQVAATGVRLRGMNRAEARAAALTVLAELEIGATQARRRPAELSGGQLQRAALARALLARPRVLLCDEVTTALDRRTAERILDHLDHYRRTRDAAVVCIGHDLAEQFTRADRIAFLDDGRLTRVGSPADLSDAPGGGTLARLLAAGGAGTAG